MSTTTSTTESTTTVTNAVEVQELIDSLKDTNMDTETLNESYAGCSFTDVSKSQLEEIFHSKSGNVIGVDNEKLYSVRSQGSKPIGMDYYEQNGSWYDVKGNKVSLGNINKKLSKKISTMNNAKSGHAPVYIYSRVINQYCEEHKCNKIIEAAINNKSGSGVVCGVVASKGKSKFDCLFLGKLIPHEIFDTEISFNDKLYTHRFYIFSM